MKEVFVARWWHCVDGNWSGIQGVYSSEEVARQNLRDDGWTELPKDKGHDADFFRDPYSDDPPDPSEYDENDFENVTIESHTVI